MGTWYWIGVSAGFGAAVGVLLAGFVGAVRAVVIGTAIAALGVGAAVGYAVDAYRPGGWVDVVAGALGALLAVLGSSVVVAGALRRGATRGGIATLLTGAAFVVAGVALIPVAGYLEAIALPALAARLRRTQPERYAGLRTLARD